MSEGYENIDSLFREEFQNYLPEVPDDSWDKISVKLNKSKNKAISFKYIWKIAATITLFIVSVGLVVSILNKKHDLEIIPDTVQNIQPGLNKNDNSSQNFEQPELASVSSVEKTNKVNKSKSISSKPASKENLTTIDTKSEVSREIVNRSVESVTNISVDSNIVESENLVTLLQIEISDFTSPKPEELISNNIPDEEVDVFAGIITNTKNEVKVMVGGQAGPQVAFRNLEPEAMSMTDYNYVNNSDGPLLAYTGGINIEVKAGRRFSVQSGIYYSKMGMTKSVELEYYQNDYSSSASYRTYGMVEKIQYATNASINIVNATGNIYSDANLDVAPADAQYNTNNPDLAEIVISDYQTAYQYFELVEIPVMAKYYLIDRKFKLNLLGGVSANILIDSPVYLKEGDLYQASTSGLNKYNYSGTLGFGVGYLINKHIRFSVEPQFKYFLNQIDKTPLADTYLYSLGLISGITYLF